MDTIRTLSRVACVASLFFGSFLLIGISFLIGCSSSGSSPGAPGLAVADLDNNRVVLYGVPLETGQSAGVVLGQPSSAASLPGMTASTMNMPAGVAVDSAGNLYVSENGNCRVTQFEPPFATGMSATLVFGQPSLTTNTCPAAATASTLGNSTTQEVSGVAVDSHGDLWVADSGSNRVVEYEPTFSSGMNASVAIGQPSLTSNTHSSPTNSTLYNPLSLSFDSFGDLWVVDYLNSRLLEFVPPFTTGMAATQVIGQTSFTLGSANQGGAITANSLSDPEGAAFDSAGNLWVADTDNNRILEFQAPFTNDMAASLVLGQTAFTLGLANQGETAPTDATLDNPSRVTFDVNGRLLVTDTANNRTLVFNRPFTSGMSATLVMGQPNFGVATAQTTGAGQHAPNGVATLGSLR